MTGIEFKAIRSANKISQSYLASQLSVSQSTISNVEKSDYAPIFYVTVLGQMLNLNLNNEDVAKKLISVIPQNYFVKPEKAYNFFRTN